MGNLSRSIAETCREKVVTIFVFFLSLPIFAKSLYRLTVSVFSLNFFTYRENVLRRNSIRRALRLVAGLSQL